jgi:hypothetical protein
MPPKPKIAATIATIKNTSVQCNNGTIISPLCLNIQQPGESVEKAINLLQ